MIYRDYISQLDKAGFSIVPNVYSETEITNIGKLIAQKELKSLSILKSKDLFAIRQLLDEVPELMALIFNQKFEALVSEFHSKDEYFISKAIYFDKPENSNWFVSYHQDLTINVVERIETEGFKNWTNKKGQIGVQPPTEYLDRTISLRIHLDDTDETNGALRVIEESHRHGVTRIQEQQEKMDETTCEVKRGGVMLMKPLTFHASSKSKGVRNRRVLHLELCDMELPYPLKWKEKLRLSKHTTPGIS